MGDIVVVLDDIVLYIWAHLQGKIENIGMHAKSRGLASIGMETCSTVLTRKSTVRTCGYLERVKSRRILHLKYIHNTARKVAESPPDAFSTRVIMDSAY